MSRPRPGPSPSLAQPAETARTPTCAVTPWARLGLGDAPETAAALTAAELMTFIPLGEALSECSTGSARTSQQSSGAL